MIEYLRPVVEEFRKLSKVTDKPIFFGECGCRSMEWLTSNSTYDHKETGKYDPDAQSRYLEAVIKSFSGEAWWKGLLVWKWDEQQVRPQYSMDPAGDTGFTVKGKPAADMLSRWFKSK